MFKSAQKIEKEKKSQASLTPEEKLFRVITSVDQEDAEVESLIDQYASPSKENGVSLEEPASKIRFRWEAFRLSPLSIIVLTVCGIIFGLVMIVSQMKPENNFYFYGNPASTESKETTPQGKTASSVVLPAKEQSEYKLVGISTEGTSKIAMIEVTADQRARFVKEGEFLPGGALVEKINEYSVQLSSGNRHWDLT